MKASEPNSNNYTEEYLTGLFSVKNSALPEFDKYRTNPKELEHLVQTKVVLDAIKKAKVGLNEIPVITPELYAEFSKTGNRDTYEIPHDNRRKNLSIATFLHFLKISDYKDLIQRYILAICSEETWVIPAHEGRLIDIYAADTGLTLAEVLYMLGNTIDSEVRLKVIETLNERIFDPYINKTIDHKWYKKPDNWNAVCNSEIAQTFLLIETDAGRKANAVKLALESLKVYLEESFKPDGSTSEGINYWNYGFSNFISFSEMLRASTNNQIDLLSTEIVKNIAAFPSKIQLGLDVFASFSDTQESETGTTFNPGIIQRLSERTGSAPLKNLITGCPKPDWLGISAILRFILWWDGEVGVGNKVEDTLLPDADIARISTVLTGTIPLLNLLLRQGITMRAITTTI